MIRGLLVVALIIMGLHVAYLFTSPVIKNTMLEGKMQEIASNHGLKGETELRRDLMEFVTDKKIDLDPESIQLQVQNGKVDIAAHYTTSVTFWFYTRDYDFFPASSEAARRKWGMFRPGAYQARS
jgi:hypothetical protein